MRTVTFSDKKVAERVNSRFVPVWYNRGKGFHNCEKHTEQWIFNSSAECYPTKNICTFFLTPDLKVVYYVAGYWAPDVFLEILDGVARIQEARTEKDRAGAHREIGAGLARRLEELQKGKEAAESPLAAYGPCRYEKTEHKHSPACAGILSEAFRYRKVVHDTLAEEGAVEFDKVQHAYKFGNPFTEEAHAAPEAEFVKPQTPGGRAPTPSRRP
jgi:hypothetical protein